MANKKNSGSVKIIDLSEQERKDKSKKTAIVITYVIAMLALWAGLFIPLFGTGGEMADRMMFRYLPSIFNSCLYEAIDGNIIPDTGEWFLKYESAHSMFGIDYVAALYVLYAAICVLSVIFLIPVCCGKKGKRTSSGCALFIEIISLLALGGALYFALITFVAEETFGAMNLVIPFGVCALVAVIQSIICKGGLGVFRLFAFLISGIAALALFDLSAIIPALSTPLNDLSDLVQAGSAAGLVTESGNVTFGSDYLYKFGAIHTVFELEDIWLKVAIITAMIYCALVLFNFGIEIIALGVGKNYTHGGKVNGNKVHNIFALIRYILTIIAGAAVIVLFFVVEGCKPGIYLYITLAITLVLLIMTAARTAVDAKRVANGNLPVEDGKPVNLFEDDADFAPVEEEYIAPVVVRDVPPPLEAVPEQSQTAAAQPVEVLPPVAPVITAAPAEAKPAESAAPVYAQPAAPGEPEQLTMLEPEKKVVYTYKAVYDGPTDAFINTLEDSEKIEFVQTFLEKSKGKISGVPDYVIGGDNSEFFPAIFVHLNRFRNILSDGLMAKIYRQL